MSRHPLAAELNELARELPQDDPARQSINATSKNAASSDSIQSLAGRFISELASDIIDGVGMYKVTSGPKLKKLGKDGVKVRYEGTLKDDSTYPWTLEITWSGDRVSAYTSVFGGEIKNQADYYNSASASDIASRAIKWFRES